MTYSVPKYAQRYITLDFIFQIPNPALLPANSNHALPGLPILGATGAFGSNSADLSTHSRTPLQDQDLKAWPMCCTGRNSLPAEYLSSTVISLIYFIIVIPCNPSQIALQDPVSSSSFANRVLFIPVKSLEHLGVKIIV